MCSKIVSDEVSKTGIPARWTTQAAAHLSYGSRRYFSAGRWLPQSLAKREGYILEKNRGLEDHDVMKILRLAETATDVETRLTF